MKVKGSREVGRTSAFLAIPAPSPRHEHRFFQMSSKEPDTPLGPFEEQADRKDVSSIDQIERSSAYADEKDSELLLPARRASAEKKLVRTLDMRLLPTIVLIFILNYIDVSGLLL